MTFALFYAAAWQDVQDVATGSRLELSGDEGNHAVRVKRVRVGERILIGSGRGDLAICTVAEIMGKSALVAEVEQVQVVALPKPRLTVVQAVIKGERMDRALETLTEAGVDRIVIWQAARSIAKLERPAVAAAKFEGKVRQASKQARRAWIPELSVADVAESLAELAAQGPVVVLDEEAVVDVPAVIPSGLETSSVTLVVGPEGGFSDSERSLFASLGCVPAAMGPVILRASTAGTVAAGWVMGATGRWTPGPATGSV